jgi:very-short-patch-repair endonuclease
MAGQSAQKRAWRLSKRQHYVITRRQLLGLGFTRHAIDERIRRGRLHPVHAGVFAVGRPDLTREGVFMAAVLACGDGAALSHPSAAEHWRIRARHGGAIHVSVPAGRRHPRRKGITVHRRSACVEVRVRSGIPVTSPIDTIVDIAPGLTEARLERAINEAAILDLVEPETLRAKLPSRPGARKVARLLDRHSYVVTETVLEQKLVPIAFAAGLGKPETQVQTEGGRVDFLLREVGVLVEADGYRFHRTASQQSNDAARHHTHVLAGIVPLRFSHWQIVHDPKYVESVLEGVAATQRSGDRPGVSPGPASPTSARAPCRRRARTCP